jgi:hypothetical protein
MKKYFIALLFVGFLSGCEKDSGRTFNNPYLPNYSFSATLNLNLPSYSQLKFDGNALAFTVDSDINIVMIKVGGSDYRAWNGNCPNQTPTACSKLSIQSGSAKCGCEDAFIYSMYNGSALNAQYIMVPYRVEVLGNNTIRVYN